MAERAIDYDRGVLIRTEPLSGVDVFMYVDSPGIYLNAHGNTIPPNFAAKAGYDIDADAKKKLIMDRMRLAKEAIEKDVNGVDPSTQEVKQLDGGYSLLGIGLGRWLLRDPEQNVLTQTAMTEEQATQIANMLVQAEAPNAQKAVTNAPKK